MSKGSMKNESLFIRIETELRLQLDAIAAEERRPLANLCRCVLEDFATARKVEAGHAAPTMG